MKHAGTILVAIAGIALGLAWGHTIERKTQLMAARRVAG